MVSLSELRRQRRERETKKATERAARLSEKRVRAENQRSEYTQRTSGRGGVNEYEEHMDEPKSGTLTGSGQKIKRGKKGHHHPQEEVEEEGGQRLV